MKKHFFIMLVLCFANLILVGQNGSIYGTIRDSKNNETLVGANVFIENTTIGASTDINGNFKIAPLKSGQYNIVISFVSYKTLIVKNVKVNINQNTKLDLVLVEDVSNLKEVTIAGTRKTDTEISMISIIKNSNLAISGISSQQISKSQDRDASEVIKRVSGINITDNRFVMVRGLSERYNTVWLNNFATPSSETDVKAFSFDMIPSSLIDRMQVNKTPAPELPGDFAGGAILIFTKSEFDKDYLNVRYSSSFRNGTTFAPFKTNYKGKFDWLGIDDGTRELPKDYQIINGVNDVTANKNNGLKDLPSQLNQKWDCDNKLATPDQRISIAFAKKFSINKIIINTLNAINYSTTFSSEKYERSYYLAYDSINNQSDTSWNYKDVQYTNAVKFGIMANWNIAFNSNHKIEFRNFLNHFGYNRTSIRNGMDYDNLQAEIRAFQFSFLERNIYSGQIVGKHSLLNNDASKIEWGFGYSLANRNEPDLKRLTQVLDKSDPTDEHYNQYYTILSNFADPRFAGRLFLKTNENIFDFTSHYEQKLSKTNPKAYMKLGIVAERKQRNFSARLLGYAMGIGCPWTIIYQPIDSIFSDKNLNSNNGILLKEKTNPSDSYFSLNNLIAGFVAFNIPFSKKINFYSGFRLEQNQQILNSFSSDFNRTPVNVDNTSINIFPSANLTINFTEDKLLRLAYGLTVNRPEFRELAPFAFYDFEIAATVRGNEELQSATIHNCDLRYEFYPNPNETIIIGAFGKYFINPIESVLTPSGSDVNYSFKNADFSTSIGLEFEAKKAIILKNNSSLSNVVKNFSWVVNSSIIKSNVFFETMQEPIGERPMQGQSPYIINAGLYFQKDSIGLQFSLLYNIVGKRIIFVGDMNTPDVYELPKNVIDFSFTQRINKNIKISGGVQDILNEPMQYCQYVGIKNTKKQITYSQLKGSYYTLGIVFNI